MPCFGEWMWIPRGKDIRKNEYDPSSLYTCIKMAYGTQFKGKLKHSNKELS